jgi:hypothetical protein
MALNHYGLGIQLDAIDIRRRLLGRVADILDITARFQQPTMKDLLGYNFAEFMPARNPVLDILPNFPDFSQTPGSILDEIDKIVRPFATVVSPYEKSLASVGRFASEAVGIKLPWLDDFGNTFSGVAAYLRVSSHLHEVHFSARNLLRGLFPGLPFPNEEELLQCFAVLEDARQNDKLKVQEFTTDVLCLPVGWWLDVLLVLVLDEEYWSEASNPLRYIKHLVRQRRAKDIKQDKEIVKLPQRFYRRENTTKPSEIFLPFEDTALLLIRQTPDPTRELIRRVDAKPILERFDELAAKNALAAKARNFCELRFKYGLSVEEAALRMSFDAHEMESVRQWCTRFFSQFRTLKPSKT